MPVLYKIFNPQFNKHVVNIVVQWFTLKYLHCL